MNEVLINGVRYIQSTLSGTYKFETEQATKQGLILPLLQALGYNIFNIDEVTPEAIADVGIKKGEKVDYKVSVDGKAVMIIECKIRNSTLSLKEINQLYRYYSSSDVGIGILTNGDDYWFFTDSEKKNIMDIRPYEMISISNLGTDNDIVKTLEKYSRTKITELNINNSIATLKFNSECEKIIDGMLNNSMPVYILEAIAKNLGIATNYAELKKLKDNSDIANMLLDKVNNFTKLGEKPVEVVNKPVLESIYDRDVKLDTEYTYDVLLNKNLDYHKLKYYMIDGVKYDGAPMIQVYFKMIDYALSVNTSTLDNLLKNSRRFQLLEDFSPDSDVQAWAKKSKVAPNLMIYSRFSAWAVVKHIEYVVQAANLTKDVIKFCFKE